MVYCFLDFSTGFFTNNFRIIFHRTTVSIVIVTKARAQYVSQILLA